jgi:hypothetical protein
MIPNTISLPLPFFPFITSAPLSGSDRINIIYQRIQPDKPGYDYTQLRIAYAAFRMHLQNITGHSAIFVSTSAGICQEQTCFHKSI